MENLGFVVMIAVVLFGAAGDARRYGRHPFRRPTSDHELNAMREDVPQVPEK